jgi:cohesin loading factor subunit SCC2
MEISKIAKDIHAKLYAKHGSLLENSYVDAVKQATKYRKRQSGDFTKETMHLDPLYNIIKGSKPSRRKFLAQLMKSIDFDFGVISLQDLSAHLDYIIFLFSGLGGIQFVSLEEVHLIVYGADKLLSGTGSTVVSCLESGERNEMVGTAAFIMCIAWGAREYLKSAYNLSENKCRDFTPNLPPKETKASPKIGGKFLIESLGLEYARNDIEVWEKRCEKFMTIMNNESVKVERVGEDDTIGPDVKRLRVE